MTRLYRIATAFLLLAHVPPVLAAERPNVIIVMTDDQSCGDLGCHGNPILKTPNLDALYAESVRFTDFQVSLRQFPKEANKPVAAERAKIKIAASLKSYQLSLRARGVVFDLDLPAGPTELVTYLYDKRGNAGGAYFAEVSRIPVALPTHVLRVRQMSSYLP
jgi:hypothetical protein